MTATSHTVTEAEYETATGHAPRDDDMERVNCGAVGTIGHSHCGWCEQCDKPRFICGHAHRHRIGGDVITDESRLASGGDR